MISIFVILLIQNFIESQSLEKTMLCDFDQKELNFDNQWGGSFFTVVENPKADSVNDSYLVGNAYKFGKNITGTSGISADVNTDILKNITSLSIKIFSNTKPFLFILKLENKNAKQTNFVRHEKWIYSINEWKEIRFDIKNGNYFDFDRVSLFFAFGEVEESDFFFDDIIIETKK